MEIGEQEIGVSHYYGLQGLKHKLFYLTKDQFTLLVMGFTGAKALAWEIEYVLKDMIITPPKTWWQ